MESIVEHPNFVAVVGLRGLQVVDFCPQTVYEASVLEILLLQLSVDGLDMKLGLSESAFVLVIHLFQL